MKFNKETGLPDFGFSKELDLSKSQLRIIKTIVENEAFLRQTTLDETDKKIQKQIADASATKIRLIGGLCTAVSNELEKLADKEIPAKVVVLTMFDLAWIAGVTASEDGMLSRAEVSEIERLAYVGAWESAEKEAGL